MTLLFSIKPASLQKRARGEDARQEATPLTEQGPDHIRKTRK
jgi:hypothetical protein